MKASRVLLALCALALVTSVSAQDARFSLRQRLPRQPVTPKSEPTIDEGSRTGGVIGRVSRADNPLQLINPFAPLRYGTGEKMTDGLKSQGSQSAGEEEKPKTWKLFSYEF